MDGLRSSPKNEKQNHDVTTSRHHNDGTTALSAKLLRDVKRRKSSSSSSSSSSEEEERGKGFRDTLDSYGGKLHREAGERMFEVELDKGADGLGFSVSVRIVNDDQSIGDPLRLASSAQSDGCAIFIRSLAAGGAAQLDGRMKPNDQIIEVNGQSLVGVTYDHASSILRRATGIVRLVLRRKETASISGSPTGSGQEDSPANNRPDDQRNPTVALVPPARTRRSAVSSESRGTSYGDSKLNKSRVKDVPGPDLTSGQQSQPGPVEHIPEMSGTDTEQRLTHDVKTGKRREREKSNFVIDSEMSRKVLSCEDMGTIFESGDPAARSRGDDRSPSGGSNAMVGVNSARGGINRRSEEGGSIREEGDVDEGISKDGAAERLQQSVLHQEQQQYQLRQQQLQQQQQQQSRQAGTSYNSAADVRNGEENVRNNPTLLLLKLELARLKRGEMEKKLNDMESAIAAVLAERQQSAADVELEAKLDEAEMAANKALNDMKTLQALLNESRTQYIVLDRQIRIELDSLLIKYTNTKTLLEQCSQRDEEYRQQKALMIQRHLANEQQHVQLINSLSQQLSQLEKSAAELRGEGGGKREGSNLTPSSMTVHLPAATYAPEHYMPPLRSLQSTSITGDVPWGSDLPRSGGESTNAAPILTTVIGRSYNDVTPKTPYTNDRSEVSKILEMKTGSALNRRSSSDESDDSSTAAKKSRDDEDTSSEASVNFLPPDASPPDYAPPPVPHHAPPPVPPSTDDLPKPFTLSRTSSNNSSPALYEQEKRVEREDDHDEDDDDDGYERMVDQTVLESKTAKVNNTVSTSGLTGEMKLSTPPSRHSPAATHGDDRTTHSDNTLQSHERPSKGGSKVETQVVRSDSTPTRPEVRTVIDSEHKEELPTMMVPPPDRNDSPKSDHGGRKKEKKGGSKSSSAEGKSRIHIGKPSMSFGKIRNLFGSSKDVSGSGLGKKDENANISGGKTAYQSASQTRYRVDDDDDYDLRRPGSTSVQDEGPLSLPPSWKPSDKTTVSSSNKEKAGGRAEGGGGGGGGGGEAARRDQMGAGIERVPHFSGDRNWPLNIQDVDTWSQYQVCSWTEQQALYTCTEKFAAGGVNGAVLLSMNSRTVKELGITGEEKDRLNALLKELQSEYAKEKKRLAKEKKSADKLQKKKATK